MVRQQQGQANRATKLTPFTLALVLYLVRHIVEGVSDLPARLSDSLFHVAGGLVCDPLVAEIRVVCRVADCSLMFPLILSIFPSRSLRFMSGPPKVYYFQDAVRQPYPTSALSPLSEEPYAKRRYGAQTCVNSYPLLLLEGSGRR